MRNLKSLTEFREENKNLDALSMKNVNGGIAIADDSSFVCESRPTQADWNCADSESRTKRDGGDWGNWAKTGTEQPDGSWSTEYQMPC
ncbi:Hypothetical protein KQS_07760 [Flavobacterium indicum GPTSA100-9 = DSM 17447]|uniref:Uncharacterized protein n=1 Tax=Flavobacterium indicum (strain DSM 17447 / CIP 109464 / GPTSA100-9) TaxID=1094466 RepID=H8XSV8_FLAIG|nr:hypothetical protein [Flavobacterium indicum]CCG53500.1 Hypothetical protein KQS_07760 [Flavobacterium indicum GPTSA100-9 = DSM 17447]